MDAGKLLGLTNCCGIAVGIAGNLITGGFAIYVPCASVSHDAIFEAACA